MTADPPAVDLEVYVGNFAGAAYGVWWDGERLVYESFEPGYREREQARLTPSRAQWQRFWRTMEELGVWVWEPRYGAAEPHEPEVAIQDGTHWSVTLAHEGRRIVSSGDGAAPDSADLGSSHVFGAFCQAVSRLAGGRPFA